MLVAGLVRGGKFSPAPAEEPINMPIEPGDYFNYNGHRYISHFPHHIWMHHLMKGAIAMKRSLAMYGVLGTALLVLLGSMKSTQAQSQEPAQQSDTQAARLLREAMEYLQRVDSFRLRLNSTMKVNMQGMKSEMVAKQSLAMQRPNKFALIHEEGMIGATVVCDGDSLYTYAAMFQVTSAGYTVREAPENIDEALRGGSLAAAGGSSGTAFFLMLLAPPDVEESMWTRVDSTEYVGMQEIDGVRCHHLRLPIELERESLNLDVWLTADGPPLVRQMIPDMSQVFAEMAEREEEQFQQMAGMEMELSLICSEWEVDVDLPDEVFQFTPPPGAERSTSRRPSASSPGTPDPMVGQPAPRFTLELLDGGQVNIADHMDKDVVILDFWATWCGPCRRAMPIIVEVANEYEDQAVVLYGVNLREPPEKIRGFLTEEGLELAVALDSEGEVGDQYGADAIPRTVIIGKDGLVKFVHVGFSPDLKETLTADLDSLLAGAPDIYTEWDVDPRLIKIVKPDYPDKAMREGIEGSVTLQIVIDEEGNVIEATVISSEPIEEFGPPALEVVLHYKFSPALKDGKPVKVRMEYTVKFVLRSS